MAWERAERDDAHDLAGPRLPEHVTARARAAGDADRMPPPNSSTRRWSRYNEAIAQFPARAAGLAVRLQARARACALGVAERRHGRSRRRPVPRITAAVAAAAGRCRRVAAVRGGESATAAIAPVWRPACARARRRWPSTRCATWAAPRPCASCWRGAPRRRAADALLCTALALCWREARRALRSLHAGRPGRGGGQAQRRHAAPGQLRQRLPAPLPARARRAGGAHRCATRWRVWNHPRWWIERLRRTSRSTGRRSSRPTTRQAPMTLRVNARRTPQRRSTCSAARGRHRRRRRSASTAWCWPGRGRCTHPGLRRGRGVGAGRRRAAGRAAAAGRAWQPQRRRCASSTPAPRPAARRRTCWSWPMLDVLALDIDPARCERIARERCSASACRRRCSPPTPAQPASLVGRPAVRRHPARRALHRLGHRAPPSRRALAAPRERHRAAGRASRRGCSTRSGRCSRRAAGCCTAPARCSGPRARSRSQTFFAHNKDAVLRPAPGHLLPQSGTKATPSRTICRVTTTVFLRAAGKARAGRMRCAARLDRAALPGCCGAVCLLAGRRLGASRAPPRSPSCELERADEGVLLSATRQLRAAAAWSTTRWSRACRCSSWPRPSSFATAGTGTTSGGQRRAPHAPVLPAADPALAPAGVAAPIGNSGLA